MKCKMPFMFVFFVWTTSIAQSNNEEYNNLLKTSKKDNVPHLKILLGLGFGTLDNYFTNSKYFYHDPNPAFKDPFYDSSFMTGALMVQASGAIDADIIETKSLYLNLDGFYTYGYFPNKKVKHTPDYLAGFNLPTIDAESGSFKINSYEFSTKFGLGTESWKVYLIAGIGGYDFRSNTYMKSQMPDPVTNISYPDETWDTSSLKLNYTKVGLGVRIGNNRKKWIFDLNAYEILPGNDFFLATENPGIGKLITSLGKYENRYPALPIGFSMSLQNRGKYEVRLDFRKLRERDYTGKNANSFSLTFSKQFDFYNKKKK